MTTEPTGDRRIESSGVIHSSVSSVGSVSLHAASDLLLIISAKHPSNYLLL